MCMWMGVWVCVCVFVPNLLIEACFPELCHTSDIKPLLQWIPCQAFGVTGSLLGLVGPVSVYYDWMR